MEFYDNLEEFLTTIIAWLVIRVISYIAAILIIIGNTVLCSIQYCEPNPNFTVIWFYLSLGNTIHLITFPQLYTIDNLTMLFISIIEIYVLIPLL